MAKKHKHMDATSQSVLDIIMGHANLVSAIKSKSLETGAYYTYQRYSEIEGAFCLLIEDLQKASYDINLSQIEHGV